MEQAFNDALAAAGLQPVAAEEVRRAARDWVEEGKGETEPDDDPDDSPPAGAVFPPQTDWGYAHAVEASKPAADSPALTVKEVNTMLGVPAAEAPSFRGDPPALWEVTNAEGQPLFQRSPDGYGGYTYTAVDRGPPADVNTEGS